MPKICRDGDLGTTGHLCSKVVGVKATQRKVFANGTEIARLGDPTLPHTILIPPRCKPHMAKVNSCSRTVFVKNVGVARVGDSYDFGSMIIGSRNVYAGD
tara:strand:- start:221 stop:520 length:300 start_codon:yes stop_codon:yes gene_type:complete